MSLTIGGRGAASPEINVTPLIDVLLVLLIIFMVVFPYHSRGEQALIPQPSKDLTLPPPSKPIVIQMIHGVASQRPNLKINEQEVSWENLDSRLQQIYSSRADKVAFLKGDPEMDFQYAADVMDTAHHAGVQRLGLMGKPGELP